MLKSLDRLFVLRLPLLAAMAFTLFPLYWAVVTSLKQEGEITRLPIRYWPEHVTFENYFVAWNNVGFSVFSKTACSSQP